MDGCCSIDLDSLRNRAGLQHKVDAFNAVNLGVNGFRNRLAETLALHADA